MKSLPMTTPEVIIAGFFGRVGQIVGRILLGNRIRATVLDHDPDQIEQLRRFGFKIYYGDATRLDLLEAAGARTAKILVVWGPRFSSESHRPAPVFDSGSHFQLR